MQFFSRQFCHSKSRNSSLDLSCLVLNIWDCPRTFFWILPIDAHLLLSTIDLELGIHSWSRSASLTTTSLISRKSDTTHPSTISNAMGALYTPRQVAAISVGSSLGALLIAFAIAVFAFFQYRKRKAKCVPTQVSPVSTGPPKPPAAELVSMKPAEGVGWTKQVHISSHGGIVGAVGSLIGIPQHLAPENMSYFVGRLSDHIDDHVLRFYKHTSVDGIRVDDLSTGLNSDDLSQNLREYKTRRNLIRQHIAQQILPSTSPLCEPELALLPLECVKLLRTMSSLERADSMLGNSAIRFGKSRSNI